MLWIGITLAAVLAAGEPAAAPAGEAATAEAAKPPAAPNKDKPKLICVQETQMGSLFKTRVCASQEEWDRRRERDQEAISKRSGAVRCSEPGC
jgi:hypothetical protein